MVVGAVAIPQLLGPDDDDRSLIADEGSPRTIDGWRTIADVPIEGRAHPAGVWTGEEVLLFGGQSLDGRTSYDDGARYDPDSDSWEPMADGPAAGRYTVVAWTGSELLLWGQVAGPLEDLGAAGTAYDPVEDRWRPLPDAPIPSQPYAAGVWTGEELVVWGGYDQSDDGVVQGEDRGAAYDPSTNKWRPIAESPLEARYYHGAVWTGDEMIVWGGVVGDGAEGRSFADGAAYDPVTDTWRMLPSATGFVGRMDPTLLWTGRDVLVWGGMDSGPAPRAHWAVYSPTPDAWASGGSVIGADPEHLRTSPRSGPATGLSCSPTTARSAGTPSRRTCEPRRSGRARCREAGAAVVWTGDEVVVWGGEGSDGPVDTGASWTPARRSSTPPTTATSVSPPADDDCVVDREATIPVPDVTGLDLGHAIHRIRAAGLTVIDRGVPSGDPTEDTATVTSQTPSAGQEVPPGACVGFRTKLGTAEGLPDLQAATPGREITFEGIGDVRLGDVVEPADVFTFGPGDDCGSWGPVEPSHDGDEPLRGEVSGASTDQPRVIRIKVWQNPTYRTASGVGVGTKLETLRRIYGDRLVVDRADGWESPTDGLLASYTDVAGVREGDAALTYHLRDDVVDAVKLSSANDWGDDEGCA